MSFKFNYQKLLEFYHQQERIAQRDYNESLNALEAQKKVYQQMYDDQDRAIEESSQLQNDEKGAPIEMLKKINDYLGGQKIRIGQQREIVVNHTQIVEQKQEILIAAAKETRILEKLKSRKLEQFKKLEKKKEMKINDELVVTRFRRGENA